jgi:hypothetical protein
MSRLIRNGSCWVNPGLIEDRARQYGEVADPNACVTEAWKSLESSLGRGLRIDFLQSLSYLFPPQFWPWTIEVDPFHLDEERHRFGSIRTDPAQQFDYILFWKWAHEWIDWNALLAVQNFDGAPYDRLDMFRTVADATKAKHRCSSDTVFGII